MSTPDSPTPSAGSRDGQEATTSTSTTRRAMLAAAGGLVASSIAAGPVEGRRRRRRPGRRRRRPGMGDGAPGTFALLQDEIKESVTMDDLTALGFDRDEALHYFMTRLDISEELIDGLSVNDLRVYGIVPSVTPCVAANKLSFKTAQRYTYYEPNPPVIKPYAPTSLIVCNASGSEQQSSVAVSKAYQKAVQTSFQSATKVKVSSKAKFLIFDGGYEIEQTVTIGKSDTETTTETKTLTATPKVPPESRMTVRLAGSSFTKTIRYTLPITVEGGWVGVNLKRNVEGSYYHFAPLRLFCERMRGSVDGTITVTDGTAWSIVYDDPIPYRAGDRCNEVIG
jgi:hypothetical protein